MNLGEKFAPPLVAGLIILMVGAVFVLRFGNTTIKGNELSQHRAIFVAANAGTLTGFQLSYNVTDYKPLGQQVIFLLIVTSSLVTMLVSGWAVTRLLKMPYSDGQIVQACLMVYLLALVVGALILMDKDTGAWAAMFNAASAFGNSGHWIGTPPDASSFPLHLLVLPLALLGGLGIPVILDLASSLLHWRAIQPHTGAVLLMTAIIYIVGWGMIFPFELATKLPEPEDPTSQPTAEMLQERSQVIRQGVVDASIETIDSRTLGLPINTFTNLARPSQWCVLLLMLIGGSSAGTAGGMKTTTPYVLARDSTRLIMRRQITPALGFASIWLTVYLLAILTTTVFLIYVYPQVQSDRLLFLAVSAIGNVGASQEPITLGGPSIHVLTLAMLFGRFAPMALLWWAATKVPGEVDVAVG